MSSLALHEPSMGCKRGMCADVQIQVREEAEAAFANRIRTHVVLPLLQRGRGTRPQVSSESIVPYFE